MTPHESRKQPKVLGVRGVLLILSTEQKNRVWHSRVPLPWARRGKWQRGSGYWRLFTGQSRAFTRPCNLTVTLLLPPVLPSSISAERRGPRASRARFLPTSPAPTSPHEHFSRSGTQIFAPSPFQKHKAPIFPSLSSLCAKQSTMCNQPPDQPICLSSIF